MHDFLEPKAYFFSHRFVTKKSFEANYFWVTNQIIIVCPKNRDFSWEFREKIHTLKITKAPNKTRI